MRGLEYPHQLEITVDGARVHLATLRRRRRLQGLAGEPDAGRRRRRTRARACACQLTAGPHDDRRRVHRDARRRRTAGGCSRSSAARTTRSTPPATRTSTRSRSPGPYNADRPRRHAEPPPDLHRAARRRPAEEEPCARRIVSTLARARLSRPGHGGRPAAPDGVLRRRAARPATSSAASSWRCSACSPAPSSCCASSATRRARRPARVYRISDLELASRLSFFLWSSIPDDELLRVARAGPAAAARPCCGSRCAACSPTRRPRRWSTNFAGQWLYLRNLEEHGAAVHRVRGLRRQPAPGVRAARRSCSSQSIMREDRNVLDLMTADYTFVNERLARHYGIPDVYGSHFRRVTLADDARRGLLGKGAVLMVSSHTDRTSPVVRGQVGARQPARRAAAADAGQRAAARRERASRRASVLTMRERMEAHRANPVCANCHKHHGPDRAGAGELRRRRARGARAKAARYGTRHRRVGRAAGRHAGRRRGRRCGRRCCATRRSSSAPWSRS